MILESQEKIKHLEQIREREKNTLGVQSTDSVQLVAKLDKELDDAKAAALLEKQRLEAKILENEQATILQRNSLAQTIMALQKRGNQILAERNKIQKVAVELQAAKQQADKDRQAEVLARVKAEQQSTEAQTQSKKDMEARLNAENVALEAQRVAELE